MNKNFNSTVFPMTHNAGTDVGWHQQKCNENLS